MKTGGDSSGSIWNKEIILIFTAVFLAYANISVFFQFYHYLKSLGLDESGYGFLIGLFSVSSLVVRPLISPLVHGGNVRFYLGLGTLLAVLSLASYTPATGFWSICLARIFHGVAFTILGAALMTLMVDHIPSDRSAQVFGLMGIVVLLPNTMVPPLMPVLTRVFGGFTHVLLLFAGITLLTLPVVLKAGARASTGTARRTKRLTGREIRDNLKDPPIALLLTAMLLLYSCHALVFFYLAGYARSVALAGAGFFFTLTSVGEIGVRLAAGTFFDRRNKPLVTALTMAGLAVVYAILGHASQKWLFFPLGLILGLGWGVAMPVLNGLMFDISRPETRAFNTNLGLQMFQAGFFLGPFIGGFLVAHWGFTVLFHFCALISILGGLALWGVGRLLSQRSVESAEDGTPDPTR